MLLNHQINTLKLILMTCLTLGNQSSYGLSKKLVKKGLGIPWGMVEFDGGLLITQRSGKLVYLNLKDSSIKTIAGAPKVYARGQGGLLDIKLHPEFQKNKRVYLSYSKNLGERKTTALGYGIFEGEKLKDFKDIFIATGATDKRIHFGSRITFAGKADKRTLFLSIGDRGVRENAQKLSNHFGKIIRIYDDGTVPKENPFIGQKNALPEIWSYGHRNPQGLTFNAAKDKLYAIEHGPRGGDEINHVEKGKNYGWPIISYGKEYMLPISVGEGTEKKGMEQPIKYYVPSIAPCDLKFYSGENYPKLKGSLLTGALALSHFHVYHPKTKKELRLFDDDDMRVRSILITKSDQIYFGTDDGEIYLLKN